MIPNSVISDDRLGVIQTLLEIVRPLDGCAIEIGCFRCGLTARIGQVLNHKPVFGFDTFEGLPKEQWAEGEVHKPGEFAFSLDEARDFVNRNAHNVTLVQGLFPDSVQTMPQSAQDQLGRICFVHLDVDYGAGITASLRWLSRRIVSGGVIVVDDYDWRDTPMVKPAVDEFLERIHGDFTLYQPVAAQAWLKKA